jgi:GT2 family glycosyltransferase
MKVSAILATTGRPDMAERCVAGLRLTTAHHDVEIIAAVDADEETARRLYPLVETVLYSDEYRGCSRAWNDALAATAGDPVVLVADDLIFRHGWLDAALDKLNGFPGGWGLVGFNDGHFGEELSTHYLMSRRFIVEVLGGVVAWQDYKHSFNDLETTERARRAGRYRWCEDAHVDHEHWLFGGREMDTTDQRELPNHPGSQAAFSRRAAAGFPNDYDPVITT